MKLVHELFGGFRIEPRELCLQTSSLECRFWESVYNDYMRVRQAFRNRANALIGCDLFFGLYQRAPRIAVKPGQPELARVLTELMRTREWRSLHRACNGNEYLAAAGASAFWERVKEDQNSLFSALKQAARSRMEMEAQADAMREMSDSDKDRMVRRMEWTSKYQQKKAEKRVKETLSDPDMQQRFRTSVSDTGAELKAATDFAGGIGGRQGDSRGWGLDPSQLQDFLFDAKLMEWIRDSERFKRIADMLGQMREAVSAERSKRLRRGPDRIEIERGDDIARALSQELMLLADPATEDLFGLRYCEGTLLLQRLEERPRLNKGPFIACTDESGSMSGQREAWAKALTCALGFQAKRERRGFGAIGFGSASEIRAVLRPDPKTFVQWLSKFFDGGTDFEQPLKRALKMIESEGLPEADIVFVTDGEAEVSPTFLRTFKKAQRKLKFKVVGIQIGSSELDGLRPFCDSAFRLDPMDGAKGVQAVISELF